MRKLLLNSSAIVTLAALTAGTAIADVSISGTAEWFHASRNSDIAASNGSYQGVANEVIFSFSNKTDTGLDIGFTTEWNTSGTAGAIDESSISIAGGFGKVVLGNNDSVADAFAVESTDLIAEENSGLAPTSSTIRIDTDLALGNAADVVKVAYYTPAIGGFTAGISVEDSGASATANAATDTTTVGARYTMDLGGTTVSLSAAQAKQEQAAGVVDNVDKNMAIKVVSGNISAIYASTNYKAADEDIDAMGVAVSYNIGNGFVIGAYAESSTDDLDAGEAYDVEGVELQYTIAEGLTAVLNHDNYAYKRGDLTSVADDGTNTKFTIKAAF
jgi:outer membrane protein OmpU